MRGAGRAGTGSVQFETIQLPIRSALTRQRRRIQTSQANAPMTTLYVGNLPFSATEAEVRSLFEQHGAVDSVKIIADRETGRPRGFAFVDMAGDAAQTALAALNGQDMNGRPLRVNEARERAPRPPRGAADAPGGRW
jgi:RNA recognition motif-containing protein